MQARPDNAQELRAAIAEKREHINIMMKAITYLEETIRSWRAMLPSYISGEVEPERTADRAREYQAAAIMLMNAEYLSGAMVSRAISSTTAFLDATNTIQGMSESDISPILFAVEASLTEVKLVTKQIARGFE